MVDRLPDGDDLELLVQRAQPQPGSIRLDEGAFAPNRQLLCSERDADVELELRAPRLFDSWRLEDQSAGQAVRRRR